MNPAPHFTRARFHVSYNRKGWTWYSRDQKRKQPRNRVSAGYRIRQEVIKDGL